MKKVININFHSRVIPIEESAYDILQQYIASLRRYFANEDGRDEIIGDIENRFAELFSESLKKGAVCITDADVNAVIASMGRPEEFEAEETGTTASGSQTTGNTTGSSQSSTSGAGQQTDWQSSADEPRRLYRADNDKLLGGVCAGLANYLRIDPAIVRIIFILITFGAGSGLLLYVILWAVLPSRSLPVNGRKRLYRNPDDRVIAGVASGLASYFHIDVWIPRVIFCLPLIAGITSGIFHVAWYRFNGPAIFTGGFGGSLFIVYIVLWMVLPEALTASEKLEMRGEKVDLESIKNTIRSEMEGVRGRAKEMGSEIKDRAQQFGKSVKQNTRNFSEETGPVVRRSTSGLGHAVGVLFKAFFLFIAGTVAFALVMVLIALLFSGGGILAFKDFVLEGFLQNFLAWTSFFLFLVIPVVAIVTWLIRRITGTRSRNHYLGYAFATLWVIGLISTIVVTGLVFNNFRASQHVEEEFRLTQPSSGKLLINIPRHTNRYHDTNWWGDMDFGDGNLLDGISDNKLMLPSVRVRIIKSQDSAFHVQLIKVSRGSNAEHAKDLASRIEFSIRQSDSIVNLPEGFALNSPLKFRNQQVQVEIAVPVGKKIQINGSADNYTWVNIGGNHRHIHFRGHDNDWDADWNVDGDEQESFGWIPGVEYKMTASGLDETDKSKSGYHSRSKVQRQDNDDDNNDADDDDDNDNGGVYKERKAKPQPGNNNNDGYRYKGHGTGDQSHTDSVPVKRTAMLTSRPGEELCVLSMLINS